MKRTATLGKAQPWLSPPRWQGWLLAFGASLAFSFATPIARWAILDGVDPTTLLLLRLWLGALLIGGTTGLMSPQHLRFKPSALWIAAIVGLANGIGLLLVFLSLARIDASMASMILSTMPLIVLLLLALRGERFTQRNTIRLAFALIGVYLLVGPGGQVDPVGILQMLCAVTFFAGQLVLIQWFLSDQESATITLYVTAITALVIGLWWIATDIEWQPLSAGSWLAAAVLAIVSTYLARLALYAAVQRIGSGQMSLLMPVEMLMTVTWSVVFLGERLSRIQWLGGMLILASTLLAIQRARHTK